MFLIGAKTVPADQADAFLAIVQKPSNFYSGYTRNFVLGGEEYMIDTRYDRELSALGLIEEEPAHG